MVVSSCVSSAEGVSQYRDREPHVPVISRELNCGLHKCRYEVQGEYVIPSDATIPKSAADMALVQGSASPGDGSQPSASPFQTAGGRWRLQVLPRLLRMMSGTGSCFATFSRV
jgi:hypothetical protein